MSFINTAQLIGVFEQLRLPVPETGRKPAR